MTKTAKWALAVGVLVIGLIVAFLPRTSRQPETVATTPDLSAARASAALAPCPSGSGEVASLKGVTAQCLGDGATVNLGTALAGHTTLINFWATWCEPCKTELPVLNAYAAEPGAATVLTVQVAGDPSEGLALLARLGVRLPAVYDGTGTNGPVSTALRLPSALPASYLVAGDGRIHFISNPRTFVNADQVRAAVEGQ
ncbi:MAG TPA: TlpA disulfide reductase family protein [Amycolatopsis sp.]|uniref:TlpA family protein disulfide reductase n=1 Tax=Amycolatopsis sp. TaxID=37632 RepID=UPI002B483E08|nr:TlpA disulfide reductase family protein [Amycolatopsis sp.]HKS45358.1 TlpA disulfide reductase family protein [Amycolatopsis sp.]